MARIYYTNDDGTYIRDDDDNYMTGEPDDCCCCDCEVDGPTADFSYDLVDDDPCTIDLTDESTAGACGEIVAWQWLKNGVEVSTVQNPTNITVANGDDITLIVTDSAGCTDEAVMEIACGYLCQHCPEPIPTTVTATLHASPEDLGLCECAYYDGQVIVADGAPGACCWTANLPGTFCSSDTAQIQICIEADRIYSKLIDNNNIVHWCEIARDLTDPCTGEFELLQAFPTLPGGETHGACRPFTVDLVI